MKDLSIISEALLMEKLGPAPRISAVADFLGESIPTTWRRLKGGELDQMPGIGVTRITLKSLVAMLNRSQAYELTHKRGKKSQTGKSYCRKGAK